MKQVDDADACWADMLEGEHRPERRFLRTSSFEGELLCTNRANTSYRTS